MVGKLSRRAHNVILLAQEEARFFGHTHLGTAHLLLVLSDEDASVAAAVAGERYLVSMLGDGVNWVRNVREAGGNVTLRHGRREEVHLEEVAPERRAPVLKAYLKRAPGARAHLPVDKDAPLEAFERVSSRFPVFRVVSKNLA